MKFAVVTYWKNVDWLVEELKEYDKVFACENASIQLLNKGIKLEKVISDFDSISDNIIIPKDFIKISTEKDKTDGRIILEYIKIYYKDKVSSIVLYNEFCERVDHSLSLLSFFELFDNFYIKTPTSFFYLLTPNINNVIKKTNSYKYISFLPIEKVYFLSIKNLKYSGKYSFVDKFSDLTISNQFLNNNKNCYVKFKKGKMLVIFAN